MPANVTKWLRELGLEQYARAFRDNDIDADILTELTADDLTSLGIASIGHRRKLLAAIAALRGAPTAQIAPDAPTSPALADTAVERRLLAILFCDLVGSTEIATRLDPEDLREVIGAYHRCVAEVLTRFGGFVAKIYGRRRPRLFRLPAGARGGCRAGGARRAGDRRRRRPSRPGANTRGEAGHRLRACRRRRSVGCRSSR